MGGGEGGAGHVHLFHTPSATATRFPSFSAFTISAVSIAQHNLAHPRRSHSPPALHTHPPRPCHECDRRHAPHTIA